MGIPKGLEWWSFLFHRVLNNKNSKIQVFSLFSFPILNRSQTSIGQVKMIRAKRENFENIDQKYFRRPPLR